MKSREVSAIVHLASELVLQAEVESASLSRNLNDFDKGRLKSAGWEHVEQIDARAPRAWELVLSGRSAA